MDDQRLKDALAGQYRAGLLMLRQCIERCPDDLWASGQHPRTFWRIAYHAAFYTHFYLMPDSESLLPWDKHQPQARVLWDDDEDGIPPKETTYSQSEMIEYVDMIVANVDTWLANCDINAAESGFSWYPIPKIDHQIVNVRHLGIHVGQLQELLYAAEVDVDWMGKR